MDYSIVNTWPVENALRPIFRKKCLLGKKTFYPKKWFRPTKELEDSYTEILEELNKMMKRVDDFPVFQHISPDQLYVSDDDKWKMFFLKGGNIRFERNCEQFPVTMNILDKYPEIVSAYFSVLGPKKMLNPHRGPWSGVLRMHMGMHIPTEGNGCLLVCNKEEYYWREGKVVVFDDTYEHFAANYTDRNRVILFLDIMRPLPWFWDKVNRFVVWCARFIPYFRTPIKRHKEWEKVFYDGGSGSK